MNENITILSLKKELILLMVMCAILLNLFGYDIYWCYLLLPILVLKIKDNSDLLDRNFILIFVFSIIYVTCIIINSQSLSGSLLFGYLVFPSTFYFFGKYLIKKYPSVVSVYIILFFICTMFSILPFVANIRSVIENGFMYEQRNLQLLWMKNTTVQNATNIGCYFALNLALLPLVFKQGIDSIEKRCSVLSLFLFATAIFSTLNMSNRTGLVIVILSLVSYIFIVRKKGMAIIIVSIIVFAIVIIYINDIWNFKTWFQYSYYFNRISNTEINDEGSRLLLWKNSIKGVLLYPYGNLNYYVGASYAHNLWLDVGRRSGILPMVILLLITFSVFIDFIKLLFSKYLDEFIKVLVGSFTIGFIATFFVEPILEGVFMLFFLFCFFFGIINGMKSFIIKASNGKEIF